MTATKEEAIELFQRLWKMLLQVQQMTGTKITFGVMRKPIDTELKTLSMNVYVDYD